MQTQHRERGGSAVAVWSILFAVGSGIDLLLTWFLVTGSRRIYEGNPIAGFFLEHFGWWGLFGFKAGMVIVVLGLIYLIARRRPALAQTVAILACLAVAAVLFYSVSLMLRMT